MKGFDIRYLSYESEKAFIIVLTYCRSHCAENIGFENIRSRQNNPLESTFWKGGLRFISLHIFCVVNAFFSL